MSGSGKKAGASHLNLVGLGNYFIISLAASSSLLSLTDYCTYLHGQVLPYPEPEGRGRRVDFCFIKISSFVFPWEPTITSVQLYPYLNKIHSLLVCSSILSTYNIFIILRKNNKKNGSLTCNAPVSLYSLTVYHKGIKIIRVHVLSWHDTRAGQEKPFHNSARLSVSFGEVLLSQLIVH